MLTRIVKITFQEDKLPAFFEHFETVKWKVATFPGCRGMKLFKDINNPSIVMTYSIWDSEEALNNYRDSELFGALWPKIKPWFAEKAEAWSVETYFDGFQKR
jgi:heme-degrading monooxygenase HmoA